MKKKFLIMLISLITAFCLCFSFAACDGCSDETGSGKESTSQSTEQSSSSSTNSTGSESTNNPSSEDIASTDSTSSDSTNTDSTGAESNSDETSSGSTSTGIPTTPTIPDTDSTETDESETNPDNTESSITGDVFDEEYYEQLAASVGLAYTLSDDNSYYSVSGIGTCTDTDIVIPSTYEGLPVTTIAEDAFYENKTITSVTIQNGVTTIEDYAFCLCTSLTSIYIPKSITYIGNYVFANSSLIESIKVNSENTSYISMDYNLYTYDGTELIQYAVAKTDTSFIIPDCVTRIGEDAFSSCSSLVDITIPNGITSIGGFAFENTGYYNDSSNWENKVLYIDTYLVSVDRSLSGSYTVKDGTTIIADWGFDDCQVSDIIVPDSVIYIGEGAFGEISQLRNITIGKGVIFIGEYLIDASNYVESFTVSSENTSYKSIDGNLYNYAGTELLYYCSGKTETAFTIPEGVQTICAVAFFCARSLTNITIPDSVTAIEYAAFDSCSSLTTVYYEGTVEKWNEITIVAEDNNILLNATIYYYSETQPTDTEGNYWHYDENDEITVWTVSA